MATATMRRELCGLLRRNGRRLTAQRQAVLDTLLERGREHLTAEEIFRGARCRSSRISLATVYKAIAFLEKEGVLRKMHIAGKGGCYELIRPGDPPAHPHCVCERCGKTIGVTDAAAAELLARCERAAEERCGFRIRSRELIYYGLCESCRAEEGGTDGKKHPAE